MRFIVTWKYKNKDEVHTETISAKNLDEAGKVATKKFSSKVRDWIDVVYANKSNAKPEY